MLQDLEAGKRTEVDSLTGYVAREGTETRCPDSGLRNAVESDTVQGKNELNRQPIIVLK